MHNPDIKDFEAVSLTHSGIITTEVPNSNAWYLMVTHQGTYIWHHGNRITANIENVGQQVPCVVKTCRPFPDRTFHWHGPFKRPNNDYKSEVCLTCGIHNGLNI